MKKILFPILLSLSAPAIFGQVPSFHYGLTIHGGLNRMKAISSNHSTPIPNWGMGIGLQFRYFPTEKIALEANPRYLYNHAGFKTGFQGDYQNDYNHYFSYATLDLPILLGYMRPINEDVFLSFWAGVGISRIITPSLADVYVEETKIWAGKGLSMSKDKSYGTQILGRVLVELPFRSEMRFKAGIEGTYSLQSNYFYVNTNTNVKPQFFSLLVGFEK